MTDISTLISRLRHLAAGASPGPWFVSRRSNDDGTVDIETGRIAQSEWPPAQKCEYGTAEFIAEANPVNVITLIEALEATRLDVEGFQCEQDENAQTTLRISEENQRLRTMINTPELENFLRAVHIEAIHQVERWGTAHDRAKRPADWFWLVGYLGGKALHAAVSNERDKALHRCVSTAAALYNWHCAIKGVDVRMCPGRSDLAQMVDQEFPGEVGQ